MKTKHSTSARLQTGLILAAASLGLLAFALVFPLRASSAMPSMPAAAPVAQPADTMPMAGTMNADMGAMMKTMSAMMDNMSHKMAAAPPTGKADTMPMADMARMGGMMKTMSDMMGMMGAMGGSADKPATSGGMGGMCACCDMMMSGKMDMMKDATGKVPSAKPAPPTEDTKPGTTTAPDATDHAAHH